MATTTLLRNDAASLNGWSIPSSLPSQFAGGGVPTATGGVVRYANFIDPGGTPRSFWVAQCFQNLLHTDFWASSTDGDTWTQTHNSTGSATVMGLCMAVNDGSTIPTNGFGVIIRDTNKAWFGSNDGVTWTSISSAVLSTASISPMLLTYGNGLYFAGGAVGGDYTFSSDFGHTWSAAITIHGTNVLLGCGFEPTGNHFYVYMSGAGSGPLVQTEFWTSTTLVAASWTRDLQLSNASSAGSSNNGFFAASTDLGQVLWLGDFVYNPVSAGVEEQVIETTNHGSTWTLEGKAISTGAASATAVNLVDCGVWHHGSQLWLVFQSTVNTPSADHAATSPDGITWTSSTAPPLGVISPCGVTSTSFGPAQLGMDINPNNGRIVISGTWGYTQNPCGTPGWRIGRPGLAFNQNTAWAVR